MAARFRPIAAYDPGKPVYAGPVRNGIERRILNQQRRSPLVHKNIAYSPLRQR